MSHFSLVALVWLADTMCMCWQVAYGAVRLMQFLFFTLFIIHWLACGYYIVASYGTDGVFTWVANAPASVANSRGELYVLAAYWAIQTATTVGYVFVFVFVFVHYRGVGWPLPARGRRCCCWTQQQSPGCCSC